MPRRTTLAPPITRVHKLFRIRTVVNDSTRYLQPGVAGVDTHQIAQILVDRKLSKISILESGNKLKRARDHALNASQLGFFVPIHQDHQFLYARTPIADQLASYRFEQGCPSDLHEFAVFIDRMMKLKLTNVYDSRQTYSKFHTRPILSILTVLRHQKLHISQIHYILSQTVDLAFNETLTRRLCKDFAKYPDYEDKSVARFMRDYKLTAWKTVREIGRSTKPLVDWMHQAGLLTIDKEGWATITENGSESQKYYANHLPIWFDMLQFNPALDAALLILYAYASVKGRRIDRSKFNSEARERLHNLISNFALSNPTSSPPTKQIDFDLNYDVPYELRSDVTAYVDELITQLGWSDGVNLNELSTATTAELEHMLTGTSSERGLIELREALGIEIPRREWFQTAFEWKVCVRLRELRLPALPYQGEFEGETDLPMATDNPDIVIKNGGRILVECKSSAEWGEIVKYDKRVGGELSQYQDYAEQVQADSAVFVCEIKGFDPDRFVKPYMRVGNKLSKVCLICWSFLDKALKERRAMESLEAVLRRPNALEPAARILC